MAEHFLDSSIVHAYWDNSEPPRLEIEPGDTVHFECRDSLDGQVRSDSGHDALLAVDFSRVHPLTGPVYVRGARPGDALEVEILAFEQDGWGWNGHLPDFGLLAEDFDYPFVQHWRIEGDNCYFRESDKVAVPVAPFCGVMGVAPREGGRIRTSVPREHGGNVDIRGLTTGATLYLPVRVDGALFSMGDGHAAQGDGEVSGTGIEMPMRVTLRFKLRRDMALSELRFITPSPLSRADTEGYYCTTAHGNNLYVNSQNAVRYMIDWLEAEHGLARSQGYSLCSAAADLRISQIVDAPNWIVSCYMPLSIFSR